MFCYGLNMLSELAGLGKYVLVAAFVMGVIGFVATSIASGRVMGRSAGDLLYQEKNFRDFYPIIIGIVFIVISIALVGLLL